MEFEYNKSLINALLKKSSHCKCRRIKVFFVTNKIERKEKKEIIKEKYDERSYGIFENSIKDEKLHNEVEEIRKIIKNS